jgi:hypothetical protein
MASSYSTDLKLELMVTGENSGTWGDKTNTNLNLLQQSIVGYQSIALTSTNTTLAMTDATISDARNAVIKFIGALSANSTVFVATGIEKTYIINNGTTGAYTLALNQVGGSSVIWGTTEKNIKGVYLDGTNANTIDLSTLGGSINTSTALAGGIVTSTQIASFAVTSTGLDTSAVTSVKIASFAVTSGALDTASVTSVKIASAAVGPTQLATTNVTAASYTAASITVDAQGRITAASSGAAGAGMGIPVLYSVGPTSGTYTANPNASAFVAYAYGGGPAGGFGAWKVSINQPYSQPYSVGGSGSSTTLGPGGSVITANGGPSGTAPGATFTYPSRTFITGVSYGSSPAQGALIIFENTGT